MKLSFSTYSWDNRSWAEICNSAKNYKFDGVEIDDIFKPSLAGQNRALNEKNLFVTRDRLNDQKLKISVINYVYDLKINIKTTIDEISEILNICHIIKCNYVCVCVKNDADKNKSIENLDTCIKQLLPKCDELDVSILLETSGIFYDTKKLKKYLNQFSSDRLLACWNINSTYFESGESCEATIKNLGAYVKHVKISDAKKINDKLTFTLIGDGDLPIDNLILALSSIDYDEYISLVWNNKWIEEIQNEEIILCHYTNFMTKYDKEATEVGNSLYQNKQYTGYFIWEKEKIIDLTFPQILDKICEKFPYQYAFKYINQDYTRTYTEFRNDVDSFAKSLIALGVKKGSKVAIWAKNDPQWYIAFWACCRIGAVLVTMNTSYKKHEVEYILNNSDTHTLIMNDSFRDTNYYEIICSLCPELKNNVPGEALHTKVLPFLRHVINIDKDKDGCLNWTEAIKLGNKISINEVYEMSERVNKHDVCNMQYTSGTTGFPKGVMLTHYNVVNNGKCIGDRMDLSTADKMMIMVPMFHCFGMVLSMTASATHGVTMCPLPYFSTKPALQCINEEKITCFNGVPTMFIAMLQHPNFAKTDFSHMRTGIMAGSPCPISVMQEVIEKMNMKEITIVYGQTEASPGCTMSNAEDPINVRVETVGCPLPGIECKIIDPETGEDLPVGENGEFVARGYNVMKGYYKLPAETAEAIDADGWLHTGDIACKTTDGNYKITGRIKDMIIRGGENIYPKEIEEFIYTYDKVKDVQVIGVPDKALGEEIYAAIIPKEGATIDEEEIRTYVLENMAKHKVPRYVEIVDSFLMNSAGKILKYKMREHAIDKFNLEA